MDYLQLLGITPAMSRMQTMASPRTLGPSFHTADQADQRDYIGAGADGRDAYNADPRRRDPDTGLVPAAHNACKLVRHPDGSASTIRLEATANGWIDPGGMTPRDMKVVAW